jgi:hypothetical protein
MSTIVGTSSHITWTVIWLKWRQKIAWNRVYSFWQLFCLFWRKNIFFRNSRFSVRSVFVINVSFFTSVVGYWQNGLRRKHGKCSLCNNWWHSFMNQRLNHVVLLYKKCNCIRIMSLNTCNKNVDIIWNRHGHQCSRIWKLSANFTLNQCIKIVSRFFGPRYIGEDFFLGSCDSADRGRSIRVNFHAECFFLVSISEEI